MHKSGDIILAYLQFTDIVELKKRPAVILYEKFGNIVVAGITSNTKMDGIKLTKKDGAIKESVIKTNYIFTISENFVIKNLFSLSKEKKIELYNNLINNLKNLN